MSANPLNAASSDAYRVQASDDLVNWVTLPSVPVPSNGILCVSHPNAGSVPWRFYRVIRQ